MKSGIFYNGVPIYDVDFEAEFEKELAELQNNIKQLDFDKIRKKDKFNYSLWAYRLNRANSMFKNVEVRKSR